MEFIHGFSDQFDFILSEEIYNSINAENTYNNIQQVQNEEYYENQDSNDSSSKFISYPLRYSLFQNFMI